MDLARSGHERRDITITEHYALIILDIMLPDIDGFRILRALRKSGRSEPVLFLTALDSTDNKVMSLDLSVDDYLVKPCSIFKC